MSNAKICQSNAPQSQSSSGRCSNNNHNRQQQSCSCNSRSSVYSYTFIMTLLTCLLSLTHARHLHDQDVSAREQLPAWHVDPFRGLADSFGEAGIDSSSVSASSSGSDSSSASSSSSDSDTLSSYETVVPLHHQRRHRRSHVTKYFTSNPQTSAPEWENPCGGVYQPEESQSSDTENLNKPLPLIKRKHLIALRRKTDQEYHNIKSIARVNYGNYSHWNNEYTFLQNEAKHLRLKLWYRSMQTYVGSFAYLGRAHYKYRKDHQQSLDSTTIELHDLLVSARSLLCEIETTINASYPNSQGSKLSHVSKEAMLNRLKFYTPADGSKETVEQDLKFSKDMYFNYVLSMSDRLSETIHAQQANSRERKRNAAAQRSGTSALSTESDVSRPARRSRAAAAPNPCVGYPTIC